MSPLFPVVWATLGQSTWGIHESISLIGAIAAIAGVVVFAWEGMEGPEAVTAADLQLTLWVLGVGLVAFALGGYLIIAVVVLLVGILVMVFLRRIQQGITRLTKPPGSR